MFTVLTEASNGVFQISEGLFDPIMETINGVAGQALPAVIGVAAIGIGIAWVRRFMGQMRKG